jgi:hypothetical protein
MPDGGATAEAQRWFSAAPSATPIADEHRALEAALYQPFPGSQRFDPSAHAPADVDKARAFWLAMMRSEYESSSVFVEMALALRDIDDPLDIQSVVLRMAQDELRHAAISAAVVEGMGGEARMPAPPVRRSAPHRDCSPEEGVLRSVIFGCCLSETVNAARLAKRHGEVSDAFVRQAIRLLLVDERLHAQFGFYYLESRRAWLEARPDVRRSLARYLRFGFAALEAHMGAVPVGARPLTDGERALGLPDLTEHSSTFQETMLNACIPGLERFGIDAGHAWRDRTIKSGP